MGKSIPLANYANSASSRNIHGIFDSTSHGTTRHTMVTMPVIGAIRHAENFCARIRDGTNLLGKLYIIANRHRDLTTADVDQGQPITADHIPSIALPRSDVQFILKKLFPRRAENPRSIAQTIFCQARHRASHHPHLQFARQKRKPREPFRFLRPSVRKSRSHVFWQYEQLSRVVNTRRADLPLELLPIVCGIRKIPMPPLHTCYPQFFHKRSAWFISPQDNEPSAPSFLAPPASSLHASLARRCCARCCIQSNAAPPRASGHFHN